jgi:hypothetical protein
MADVYELTWRFWRVWLEGALQTAFAIFLAVGVLMLDEWNSRRRRLK